MLADSENEDFTQTLNEYWDSTQYIALCGTFPQGFNAKIFNDLDFSDKHIFVDAIDGIDELLAKGVDVLKINMLEYCVVCCGFRHFLENI